MNEILSNQNEIDTGKWFQTELMALTLEISLISNRNEINEIDFSVFRHLKSMKPFPMAIEINEIATLSADS